MVGVRSEIGRLRRVLVHEPGEEVDRMVPAMMEELLFDDILYGDRAREEHALFRRVLQLLGIETIEASDLLEASLAAAGAREWVGDVILEDVPDRVRRTLLDLDDPELARALVVGRRAKGGRPGRGLEHLFELPPLPNWCFQRDPQVVLGDGVLYCRMKSAARHREALLSRAIFRFHPDFAGTPVLFDAMGPNLAVDHDPSRVEGGDVLVLSPDIVAVGISERTNASAVHHLVRALARREPGPRWLVAVELPRRRAYMHLDTLMTPIDRALCLAYPPVVRRGGGEAAPVTTYDLHATDPTEPRGGDDGILEALAALGLELEPVPCGGDDPVSQQREQWTDGANALALAPGVLTLYDRNVATAEELSRRGFRVVDAEDLLLGREELDLDATDRACVLLPSHEISRARGGPHCLTHPIERDPCEVGSG